MLCRSRAQADFVNWLVVVWSEPWLVFFVLYCLFLVVAVLLLSVYHTVASESERERVRESESESERG